MHAHTPWLVMHTSVSTQQMPKTKRSRVPCNAVRMFTISPQLSFVSSSCVLEVLQVETLRAKQVIGVHMRYDTSDPTDSRVKFSTKLFGSAEHI